MQPLSDLTGSRRFLCFETLKIDMDGLEKIDINQCYAQALHLIGEDFIHYFSGPDIVEIEENNRYFQAANIEEELLLKHFGPIKSTDFPQEMTLMTSEILKHICDVEGLRFQTSVMSTL